MFLRNISTEVYWWGKASCSWCYPYCLIRTCDNVLSKTLWWIFWAVIWTHFVQWKSLAGLDDTTADDVKLQNRIFWNDNNMSIGPSNKTRQKSMWWTLSISVPDYGSESIVRRFYLYNSEKANVVNMGKKAWLFTLMFSCYSQPLVVINNNF